MAQQGFIKLWRELAEKEAYRDIKERLVFIHLLIVAEWKQTERRGCRLNPGDVLITVKELEAATGLSAQEVRTALNKLTKQQTINKRTTNQYSIITIENWRKYQGGNECGNKRLPKDQQTEQQANNKPSLSKEGEEIQRREEATPYGEFENVFLTPSEFEKLTASMPTQYTDYIENLSLYMERTGKTYQNHYLTILAWKRRDEQRAKEENKQKSVSFLDLI